MAERLPVPPSEDRRLPAPRARYPRPDDPPDPAGEVARARDAYQRARRRVDAARRLIRAGQEGASVLHRAEHGLVRASEALELAAARAELARDEAPEGA